MNDVEGRLRAGLRADITTIDTEGLLADVQHGVARRRRRRLAIAVVATIVAVVGGIGAAATVRGSDDTLPPVTTRTPTPTLPPGATSGIVSISASGDEVYRLTVNLGCVACSTLWRQEPSAAGGWERLHDFGTDAYAGPADPVSGPVTDFVMGSDGNGWAWGLRLFATHDGGRTWAEVTTGPGRTTTDSGHQVVVTDPSAGQYAWSLLRTDRGTELWRTPASSDGWTRIRAPHLNGASGILTIGRHVALEISDEGLADPRLQYSPDGTTWGTVADPCPGDHRILPALSVAFVLCPGKHATTVHVLTGPEHQVLDLDHWETIGTLPNRNGDAAFPLGDDRVLVVARSGAARLVTLDGTSPVDLGLEPGEEPSGSAIGTDQVLLTTYGADQHTGLLRSTDGGLTWSREE